MQAMGLNPVQFKKRLARSLLGGAGGIRGRLLAVLLMMGFLAALHRAIAAGRGILRSENGVTREQREAEGGGHDLFHC